MIYKNFKNEKISYLGLGLMRHNPNDLVLSQKIIDFAITCGINYFEGCYFYLNNQCESILAKCLLNYPRENYYLCDKFPLKGVGEHLTSLNKLEDFFNQQLNIMNTKYFDFYLIQAIDDSCLDLLFKNKILSFFIQKKKEGFIKYLGFSFHGTPIALEILLKLNCWDLVQLQLNYYDYYLSSGKQNYDLCKEYNIPIWVMGANKGGLLVQDINKNISNDYELLPYKFLYDKSQIQCILSGAENLEILSKNIKNINSLQRLSKEDENNIQQILENYKQTHYIQCTKCNYCQPCPKGIDIPNIFYNYNLILKEGVNYKNFNKYMLSSKFNDTTNQCIECHQCERKCPQHLNICDLLKTDIFQMRL